VESVCFVKLTVMQGRGEEKAEPNQGALVYDQAAYCLRGDAAHLNFLDVAASCGTLHASVDAKLQTLWPASTSASAASAAAAAASAW
jgi:EREBP-like factor